VNLFNFAFFCKLKFGVCLQLIFVVILLDAALHMIQVNERRIFGAWFFLVEFGPAVVEKTENALNQTLLHSSRTSESVCHRCIAHVFQHWRARKIFTELRKVLIWCSIESSLIFLFLNYLLNVFLQFKNGLQESFVENRAENYFTVDIFMNNLII